MNSEDIIRISSKRLGDNRPVIDHLSDDTFAILGPREQAHVMLDKILRHSDKPTFTCIARLVPDTEKAVTPISTAGVAQGVTPGVLHHGIGETKVVPAPDLDGSVLSRRSLDAALEKWSTGGKPDIKLKFLVDEMERLEPQARSVELLVIQRLAAKNPRMTVFDFNSMFSTAQRYCYNQIEKQGKTQVGKDTICFNLLVHFWLMSIDPSLGPGVSLRLGPDNITFPWHKLRPSNMAGGPDPSYENFLQERK
ncbi:uncharacterized protein GLRG_03915 [Colletotrichum graminicola M1.001]|uniref:Uncharacterized protein n=1 Tax=Colletotrichum graminicola (strain M1.001 / M2 / FGSC 10212) TaxID=645133 RepID=E3QCZ9_COLGM|nr:uncharacterized protein GLRG_03915 [Colletotrichum graminicola M1.001]EFQ28771.1 hypothetical protein GLRG_03915 [Colletotrichum graminicola M1.001]